MLANAIKAKAYLAHFTFFYAANKVYVNFRFHNSFLSKSRGYHCESIFDGAPANELIELLIKRRKKDEGAVQLEHSHSSADISRLIRYSAAVATVHDKTSLHVWNSQE